MITHTDERISAAARAAFAASLDATGDQGCALDAAHEAVAKVTPDGVTGTFDDETLTFTRDDQSTLDVALRAKRGDTFEIHSEWIDDVGRECGRIEIQGAHHRLARIELSGDVTVIDESSDDPDDPILEVSR